MSLVVRELSGRYIYMARLSIPTKSLSGEHVHVDSHFEHCASLIDLLSHSFHFV